MSTFLFVLHTFARSRVRTPCVLGCAFLPLSPLYPGVDVYTMPQSFICSSPSYRYNSSCSRLNACCCYEPILPSSNISEGKWVLPLLSTCCTSYRISGWLTRIIGINIREEFCIYKQYNMFQNDKSDSLRSSVVIVHWRYCTWIGPRQRQHNGGCRWSHWWRRTCIGRKR